MEGLPPSTLPTLTGAGPLTVAGVWYFVVLDLHRVPSHQTMPPYPLSSGGLGAPTNEGIGFNHLDHGVVAPRGLEKV